MLSTTQSDKDNDKMTDFRKEHWLSEEHDREMGFKRLKIMEEEDEEDN